MAIRITCAYKTIKTNAILDVAVILSLKLQAADKYKTHEAKWLGQHHPSKQETRINSIRNWQSEWERSETGHWTRRLILDLQPWVMRLHGDFSCCITQFFTGPKCFGSYLFKFKMLDPRSVLITRRQLRIHACIFRLRCWWRQRRELELEIETNIPLDKIIADLDQIVSLSGDTLQQQQHQQQQHPNKNSLGNEA
ncbi:hypothetical protein AGLY_001733 [Aphis glycines]|uniref:Uncharacterized protein n=1 Tax=Aphis glycines TaxID=307491 RepID=A0A6G0U4N9_APHGL|nr:hypothetical protein AGLY_001733 [Aphis glycines]